MSISFGHNHLLNRYIFKGALVPLTPLRISSGRASETTDAPFITNAFGFPYIPGSTLRGAIRSEIERIIAGVGATASGLTSCTLFEQNCCGDKIYAMRKAEEEKNSGEDGEKIDARIAELAEKELCDVCKLFGSTFMASKLFFEDSYPAQKGNLSDCRMVRDGVGIDRDTGSAKDGAKFDYEVIEPKNETAFLFTMIGENLTPNDKKLINLIRALLKEGIFIGGKRSGGLGKIRVTWEPVMGFEDLSVIWKDLMAGKPICSKIEWAEESAC
jgi:CRISPR-associated protein Csm3